MRGTDAPSRRDFDSPNRPDFSGGFLRVPLPVWLSVFCRTSLTRRELQLVSVVLRETWGWTVRGREVRPWTRPLTMRQFSGLTGLSTDHLARDLRNLVDRGVLLEREGRYQFVPYPQRWRPRARKSPRTTPETRREGEGLAPLTGSHRNVKESEKKRPLENGDNPGEAGDNRPHEGVTPVKERFAGLLETLAGPLSPEEKGRLRLWIGEAGIADVWEALHYSLLQGSESAGAFLRSRLMDREG